MHAAAPTITSASSPASAGCRSRSCGRGSTSTRSSGSATSKAVPKPKRGSREALERVRDQAAIQLRARRLQGRQHEVLPLDDEHGFLRLPEPARGDLFLDLEGDRLALDGGREYLFGVSDTRGGYTPLWATSPAEEKRAFEQVVDRILAAFEADRAMHVYHFGAYEPTAFKRLSGRYATRETELDVILRAELFVDLHTIVKHSLARERRDVLAEGSRAVLRPHARAGSARRDGEPPRARVGHRDARGPRVARGPRRPAAQTSARARPRRGAAPRQASSPSTSPIVERYNRDDCVSAAALRDWLEELRAAAERESGEELPRPELQLRRGQRASRRGRRGNAARDDGTARRRARRRGGAQRRATGALAHGASARMASARRESGVVGVLPPARPAARGLRGRALGARGPRLPGDRRRHGAQADPSLRVPAAGARRAPRRRGLRAGQRASRSARSPPSTSPRTRSTSSRRAASRTCSPSACSCGAWFRRGRSRPSCSRSAAGSRPTASTRPASIAPRAISCCAARRGSCPARAASWPAPRSRPQRRASSRSRRHAARASGNAPPPRRRARAKSTTRYAKPSGSRSSSTTACCRSKARPARARPSRART